MRHYLLVDDNSAFAENLAEILRDQGNEATVTTSGPEALALARQRRFDAIITDMRMPAMSGAELVAAVRRIDPGIAVVVITAYTGDEDLVSVSDEGLLAVLPKPVPLERLLAVLAVARRDGLVALVEDDLSLCDNLRDVLTERGYGVVTANSVGETPKVVRAHPFAALVDLRVPGGPDGEAMRRLADTAPEVPILVMTGLEDVKPPLRPVALLPKPFDVRHLLELLDHLHRGKDAER